MGAVQFIETMDHTSLSNITQDEFEKCVIMRATISTHILIILVRNVEEAIQTLPPSEPQSPVPAFQDVRRGITAPNPHAGEESAQPLSLNTPAQTLSDDAKRLLQKTGDTISKPLNALGRIFSEALDGAENKLSYLPGPFAPFELGRENRAEQQSAPGSSSLPSAGWAGPQTPRPGAPPQTPHGADVPYNAAFQTPYKARVKRVPSPSFSPAGYGGPEDTPSRGGPYTQQALAIGPSTPLSGQTLMPPRIQQLTEGWQNISRTPTPALDIAGVQEQIDSVHEQAAAENRETLQQMFPGVDVEVIDWVIEANEGDLGRSIEALLEMSKGA